MALLVHWQPQQLLCRRLLLLRLCSRRKWRWQQNLQWSRYHGVGFIFSHHVAHVAHDVSLSTHECRSTFFGVLIAPPLASACFPELHAGKLWGGRRCLRRRRRRRWLRPHRPRHLFLRCIPFVRARTYHTILELLASFFTFRDDLDCRIRL